MPEPSASDRRKAAQLSPDVASTLLVDCAERGLTLRFYCSGCQTLSIVPAAELCRVFDGWMVDELQRAGVLGCGACRAPGSISVYGKYWRHPLQLEHWASDEEGYAQEKRRHERLSC